MGIMERNLKSLIPKSWNPAGNFLALLEGLAVNLERIRVFLFGVCTEAEPGTADVTLEAWFNQLGLSYDSSLSTATLQAKANQAYSSTGGQDLDYLQGQLQIAYPNVYIAHQYISTEFMAGVGMAGQMQAADWPSYYPDPIPDDADPQFYYRVYGEVDTVADLTGVEDILSRIMPVPYEPIFSVEIVSLTERADAGLGMAGLMMSGRSE